MSTSAVAKLEFNKDYDDHFEERTTWFAEVIVPVPIPGTYTYRVPQKFEEQLTSGCRVIIQFGRRKVYTGLVESLHNQPPKSYEAKYILDILDDRPTITGLQLEFFKWIAQYYMCTIGEVYNAALPGGLKLTSESFIQKNPNFDGDTSEFTEKELRLLELLDGREKLNYEEASEALDLKQIHPVLKSLIQKDGIYLFEQLKDKYKPRTVAKVRLTSSYVNNEESIKEIFDKLEKRPKQLEVLLKYFSFIPIDDIAKSNHEGIEKSKLLTTGVSESSLKTLIKNGVLEQFEEIVSRFPALRGASEHAIDLSENQRSAKDEINRLFIEKDTVLLHGITGSGKTEIYISYILELLKEGGQVLYLLPEIALTTQIVNRLRKVFGDEMGIYHSKFSDSERVEVWKGVESGRFSFVVGVRSAIFLPFDQLSMIIVDEEHDSSYKQFDPAPRYNVRDLSVVLAGMQKAKVLLGTATPSLESYENALSGKYGLVELTDRYAEAALPEFILADLNSERKRKTIKGDFSSVLIEELRKVLENEEQAILFQNRRGYSPYISCNDCAHVPKCENCAVSLTYHMYSNTLKCHYCGYQEMVPSICASCGSTGIRTVGFGTEKLEEDLKLIFPEARIQRMDQDTTRSKYSYQSIIDRFEKRDTDILIGTQMISKGLDFDHVTLVGVFDFDRMIHFPDFRSYERAFQLVTQVSGRSGRKDKPGKVVVQTADVSQSILDKIVSNDYKSFYQEEVLERSNFLYPPWYRMIKVIIKHKDKSVTDRAAKSYGELIIPELGAKRVLGPQEPAIARIRNQYFMELFLKLEKKGINMNKVKDVLFEKSAELLRNKKFSGIRIIFDVDPV